VLIPTLYGAFQIKAEKYGDISSPFFRPLE
jgi:hypothetical protein